MALLVAGATSGCVRDAVLENEVRRCQAHALALTSISDWDVAEAALASELVSLEALYVRRPDDVRVRTLLRDSYLLHAQGFVEARRLEALAAGDVAGEANQRARQADSLARAAFYGRQADAKHLRSTNFRTLLAPAEGACQSRDRVEYERALSELLARPVTEPTARLDAAVAKRLAQSWLTRAVSARCRFAAP